MPRIEKVWAALSISSGIGFPFQVTLAQEYGTPNSAMPAIMVTKIGSRCSRDHVERPPTSGNTALFVSLNCAWPGAAGCSLAILVPPLVPPWNQLTLAVSVGEFL